MVIPGVTCFRKTGKNLFFNAEWSQFRLCCPGPLPGVGALSLGRLQRCPSQLSPPLPVFPMPQGLVAKLTVTSTPGPHERGEGTEHAGPGPMNPGRSPPGVSTASGIQPAPLQGIHTLAPARSRDVRGDLPSGTKRAENTAPQKKAAGFSLRKRRNHPSFATMSPEEGENAI